MSSGLTKQEFCSYYTYWKIGIGSCKPKSELTSLQGVLIAIWSRNGCSRPKHSRWEEECFQLLLSAYQQTKTFPENSLFSSVAQSCPTLYDPMNCSTPGLPVHHQLPEFTQTHVHRVGDAIQPSHPLSSSSPPAPNPSQHQDPFQWVNSSHEVAKVLEFPGSNPDLALNMLQGQG